MPISQNDIVIFTGANNCGKSRILRDIHNIIKKKDCHNRVVVQDVVYAKVGDIEDLKKIFRLSTNGLRLVHNNISIIKDSIGLYWKSDSLSELTPLFVNLLSTENRLADLTTAFGIEWTTIESHWNNISSFAKSKSQIPTKRDVKDSIDAILTELKGVDFTPDAERAIKKAMKNTSGWTQIKEDGYTAFKGDSISSYIKLDSDCRAVGLFCVGCFVLCNFDGWIVA